MEDKLKAAEPLSLEQLRGMANKPYWHVGLQTDSPEPRWKILDQFVARCPEDYGYGKRCREAWEPCGWCEEFGDPRYKLYAGYSMQKTADDIYEGETEELNYCPRCGRPLTPGAWAELEKRMVVRV